MTRFVGALSAQVFNWASYRQARLDHYGWGGGAWTGRGRWTARFVVSR